jgi:hypothetical protein
MVSTVEDLSRFAYLQFRDDPEEVGPVLKGSTLREMHRIHWLFDSFSGGRGLGFSVFRSGETTFVTHGGWIGGNRTHFLTVPREKIAVIAALNADDGSPYVFSRQAYETLAPALLAARRSDSAVTEDAEDKKADPSWQAYEGLYTDPWGWEYQVMILGDELVIYGYDYPPYDDATSGFTRLTPLAGHTFRRPDNELVTFELDHEGYVTRIKRRYDYIYPVEKKDD